MPQRYKLRLGDGTVLSVDIDGLRAWVHDPKAVAQVIGSQQWRSLRDLLADEENTARLLRALIPPQPKKEATPPPSAPPAAAPAPSFDDPHPLGDATPPYLEPVSNSPPTFGSQLGFGEPAFGDPAPFTFDEPSPVGEPAPAHDPAPFTSSPVFNEPQLPEPAAAARQSLQVLADETSSSTGTADASEPGLSPIRLRPLDDDRGFRSAWEEGEPEDEARQDHLQGPLLTLLAPLGVFLSRTLASLTPLVDRLSRRSPRSAESSFPSLSEPSPLDAIDRGPSLGERLSAAWTSLGERRSAAWSGLVAGWGSLVAGWGGLVARLRRSESKPEEAPEEAPEEEPEPEVPRAARAPLPPRASAPPEPLAPRPEAAPYQPPTPRPPVAPPPAISSIPVLPLAEAVQPREEEDVYDVDEPSDFVGPLWFWTKRLVVLGALAAVGTYAYREREQWFPRAGGVGQTIFRAIDQQAHARERERQRQQALAAAVARLPHLTPQTILLTFGQSPTGVLEAPDVFQVTREAAERGLDKLPPADAQELRTLEHELAAALRPPERRRLEEYDEARTRRVIFPFENPYAMDLVAKGARSMPPERLERLRALTQQAVTAGLAVPVGEPSDGAAR